MTLLIDEIYNFYNNPQNLAAFEEWKERKRNNDDTAIKGETQKTNEN